MLVLDSLYMATVETILCETIYAAELQGDRFYAYRYPSIARSPSLPVRDTDVWFLMQPLNIHRHNPTNNRNIYIGASITRSDPSDSPYVGCKLCRMKTKPRQADR